MKFGGSITKLDQEVIIETIRKATETFKNPVFVEVGICRAQTSRAIMETLNGLKVKSKLICIDKNLKSQKCWKTKCQDRVGFCASEFILSDSWSFTPKEKNLAWVFIDACHCYECVKKDIEHWAPLVAKNGFLVFHDVNEKLNNSYMRGDYHNDGVKRLFAVPKALDKWKNNEWVVYAKGDIFLDKKGRWTGGAKAYRKQNDG